jgi:hypothetical protein
MYRARGYDLFMSALAPASKRRGGDMPSITQQLAATRTAQWYQAACGPRWVEAWNDRNRCFDVLAGILREHQAVHRPGHRARQPSIHPHGVLAEVAHRAHFASAETVYRRWRAKAGDRAIARWAGADPAVKPSQAFLAEAKIVAFWPYRDGAMQVADAFDMSLAEVAASYYRALGAWAGDNPALAACDPAGPPGCVAEDMEVLARHFSRPADISSRADRLTALAGNVVARILDDASLTPLGSFNTIREEVLQLLSPPADPVAARAMHSVAELADRLLHRSDDDAVLTAGQARQLRSMLHGLSLLLASAPAGTLPAACVKPGQDGSP